MHQMVSTGDCASSPSPAPSPAADSPLHSTTTHYQRPSSLHGLKHKLAGGAVGGTSEVRRASLQHMPLSPLARTPSPSPQPQPASPTSRVEARSPSPLAAREGGARRAWPRRDPASPLLRRALSPDRLHPRSAEAKCSISPLCCGGTGAVAGAGSTRRSVVWRAAAPAPPTPTPPPVDKGEDTSAPLPRIAEEKDSPTHHARNLPNRTPAKQSTPSIFTSSPKTSLDKSIFDASASFASLSLSDESFTADTSADMSNLDTSRETYVDDSRTSTEPSITVEEKLPTKKPIEPTEATQKVRKSSDSSLKDEDLKSKVKQEKIEVKKQEKADAKKQEKVDTKKQENSKSEEKQEVKEDKSKIEKVMERAGSIKKSEKERDSKKVEKEKKQAEPKRSESIKKLELKKQESVDTMKSPESLESEGRSKNSMVSKLLGVMGRKGTRDKEDDDHRASKKAEKHAKKKNQNQPPQPVQPQPIKPEPQPSQSIDKDNTDDKKSKKNRGRASSSSSGEKSDRHA